MSSKAGPDSGGLRTGHLGLMQLVGQSFSIGPLIDIALFLGIVAALAGAIGPLAVALAAVGMAAFEADPGFAARARSHAATFSWGATARGYARVYESVLG